MKPLLRGPALTRQ